MTSFTFCLFILAAVLHVDDADLVHKPALVTVTLKKYSYNIYSSQRTPGEVWQLLPVLH
jgi:hypothetical protein